jgi:RNA polymerase sigma-70 factor (ECF subfamily)
VDALYREHHVLVGRVCAALLRNREDAADAKQQTFLHAQRALRRGVVPHEPRAWLATIARNECIGQIRARMRAPLPLEARDAASSEDVTERVAARASAASLLAELRRLPPQQRDAFVLRELAGLPYEELAAVLGLTSGAVESLLVRARTRLRAQLRAVAASLNLSGLAARVAELAPRLLDPAGPRLGAVPKAVAATFGVVAIGGAGFAELDHTNGRPLHRALSHAVAAAPVSHRPARRVLHDWPQRAATVAPAPQSAPPPPVPVDSRTPVHAAVASRETGRVVEREHEHRRRPPVIARSDDSEDTPTLARTSGDDGGDRGGGGGGAVAPAGAVPAPPTASDGEGGDGGDGTGQAGAVTTIPSVTTSQTDGGGDGGPNGGPDGGGGGDGSGGGGDGSGGGGDGSGGGD